MGAFGITILGNQHEELCRTFSRRGADRFTGRNWAHTRAGHPIPADGLGWLDCTIVHIQPAGDHELVIAETTDGAITGHGNPLVFQAGRFTSLSP
jgi:flavin reductase (DIM6/NTAB) family NADH-FMN oxidoreductase RutF